MDKYSDILDYSIIQGLKELGDDEEDFFKEVVELYIEQAPTLINEIKTFAYSADADNMGRAAHTLKGASLNVGAKKLAEVCKVIEFDGKSNNLSNVAENLKNLDSNYEISKQALLDACDNK